MSMRDPPRLPRACGGGSTRSVTEGASPAPACSRSSSASPSLNPNHQPIPKPSAKPRPNSAASPSHASTTRKSQTKPRTRRQNPIHPKTITKKSPRPQAATPQPTQIPRKAIHRAHTNTHPNTTKNTAPHHPHHKGNKAPAATEDHESDANETDRKQHSDGASRAESWTARAQPPNTRSTRIEWPGYREFPHSAGPRLRTRLSERFSSSFARQSQLHRPPESKKLG